MTIDEVYRLVQFIAKKSQSGNNPSPAEFNLAAISAQLEWVKQTYNVELEKKNDNSYEKDQENTDNLNFLKTEEELYAPSGKITIPTGSTTNILGQTVSKYMYLSSIRRKYYKSGTKERMVDILRDSELANIINSSIIEPTDRYPYGAVYNTYIQLYPKTNARVLLTYLRYPSEPLWAFTTVNGRPLYDASNSTDLEAPEQAHNDIVMRILRYLGMSIREQELLGYSQAMVNEGL